MRGEEPTPNPLPPDPYYPPGWFGSHTLNPALTLTLPLTQKSSLLSSFLTLPGQLVAVRGFVCAVCSSGLSRMLP